MIDVPCPLCAVIGIPVVGLFGEVLRRIRRPLLHGGGDAGVSVRDEPGLENVHFLLRNSVCLFFVWDAASLPDGSARSIFVKNVIVPRSPTACFGQITLVPPALFWHLSVMNVTCVTT